MTLPEITQLRTSGHLDDALREGRALLAQYPADRFVRIDLAWTLKALAEQAAQQGDASRFTTILSESASLRLGEIGEQKFYNRFAWDLKTLLDKMPPNPDMRLSAADRLADIIMQTDFLRPDRYYTMLLMQMSRFKGHADAPWLRFYELAEWWGFDNLLPDDFQKIKTKRGQLIPSNAEQLYTDCFKCLEKQLELRQFDAEQVKRFAERLTELAKQHPEFAYPNYHATLLFLGLGLKEQAREAIRPFVKRKQGDSWVWKTLGEAADDPQMRFSCYCRALTCRALPEFHIRIRRKIAHMLLEANMLPEARFEVDKVAAICREKKWSIPREIVAMMQAPWYGATEPAASNDELYRNNLSQAESFIYADLPEEAILISHYDARKQVSQYITADHRRGFFFTRGLRGSFAENQVLLVRFAEQPQADKPSRPTTYRWVTDKKAYVDIFFKKIDGNLHRAKGKDYGFVENIFVDAKLLTPDMTDGTRLTGTAVISFDRKKQAWGWRAASARVK